MQKKSLAFLLILPLIWGTYYVASNWAVGVLSVFSVGIVIRFITLILLSIIMGVKHQLGLLLHVEKVWKRLLVIGMLGFLLDTTAFLGFTFCPAGIGTVLLKSDVIFVNLISVLFYKQKLHVRDWIFTFIMIFGIVLVMDIDWDSTNIGGAGNLFFIASALFVSINAFVIKSVQHDPQQPTDDGVIAYYNNFITLILFTIAASVTGDIHQLAAIGQDKGLIIALLVASVGQTLIYIFYYYDLRRFPVWIVKVFLLLVPIVAALISWVLFDERLNAVQITGIVIVLACAGGILTGQKGNIAASEMAVKD